MEDSLLRIAPGFLILYATPRFDPQTARAAFFVEVSRDHMRIGLAYNEKPAPASAGETASTNDAFAEWDDPSTIVAVEQALRLFGTVIRLEADQFFPQNLALAGPHLVFNMAEGLPGQNREALVPPICEYLNVPHTGSHPLPLPLPLHQYRTK